MRSRKVKGRFSTRRLYETFVADFKHKLNRLALSRLQIAVANQYKESEKVIFFGNTIAEDAKKDDRQASIYILSEISRQLHGSAMSRGHQKKQQLQRDFRLVVTPRRRS